MRAIVYEQALTYVPDRPDPLPGADECLVRVHYAGICATDLHITEGYMNHRGVLGHEMVGTVVRGSREWQGKRVVCDINCVCRTCDMCTAGLAHHCRRRTVLGIDGRDGCFADFIAVPERNLFTVPSTLTDEEAVFVEPLAAACQVLAQASIESRMTVSVVGSGRLGLLVAQLLAGTGCKLTVVGRNPQTLLFCEKKGIQAIAVDELVPRQDRDVVVECTGSPEGLRLAMELVRPRGSIMLKSTFADALAGQAPLNLAPIVVNEVQLVGSRCGPFPEAINALARGAVEVRSMISRVFPLPEGLAALDAARRPDHIKVLLKISLR
ncbi:MAG TPA: alcohol dehydrogenase catalytic domain-containing protein [Phycisphaerae bacterium]|nr:alcohol dehydrogenase catalytic domain-containing protein [Phycisphaerae bacterium]HNU46557.1 alcohol dehydrogenase catalytic domain-containing protein [Phycisphaerae bacterium]